MGNSQSREDYISYSDGCKEEEEEEERSDDTEEYQDAQEKQPTPIGDLDTKLKALKLKYRTPSSSSSTSSFVVSHNTVKLYLHIGGNTPNAKWIVSNKLTSFSFVKTTNVDSDSDDDNDYEGSSDGKGQWILKVGGKVQARVSTDMQLKMFADQRPVDFV